VDVLVSEVAGRDHASTEQLSALLDNRAEPAELPFLADHLGTCDACQQELNGLRAVCDLLRRLPVQLPPRAFTIAPARPVARFRRLIPVTRVLSALAAVFCVVLFSADAMGASYDATPMSNLTSTMHTAPAAEPAATSVTPLPTTAFQKPPPLSAQATQPPAAAKPAAASAAAAKPAERIAPPAAAAPPPPAPASSGAPGVSSGAMGRSADAPVTAPSGGGAAPPAPIAAEARTSTTTMATLTPITSRTSSGFAPTSQDAAPFGFSPLRTVSIVLGLLAIGLFIGSVLLKRVALAPLDVHPEHLDR
jgi:hypothetical protein